MKKTTIIGFGRFGQLLASLAKDSFDVSIVENLKVKREQASAQGFNVIDIGKIGEADFIFLAVPISNLETVLEKIAPIVQSNQVVIDICSVKVYPASLLKKYLPHCQTLASHPLFGPDSAQHGLSNLQVVLCPLKVEPENLKIIESFWQQTGAQVIFATPEEHDKDSVYSQAFTYSVAHLIQSMKLPKLRFTTKSFRDIKEVSDLSSNDSPQLFHDMLLYNPYFHEMKQQLEDAVSETLSQLEAVSEEPSPFK